MRYHKSPCPVCGNTSVYSTTAVAEGATDHATGKPVKAGQELDRCDSCGAVTIKTPPKPKAKPKAKPKPAAATPTPAKFPTPRPRTGAPTGRPTTSGRPTAGARPLSGFDTPADA